MTTTSYSGEVIRTGSEVQPSSLYQSGIEKFRAGNDNILLDVLDSNNFRIKNTANPVQNNDVVNKQTLDGEVTTLTNTVNNLRLDTVQAPTGSVDLNSQKIINLQDPSGAQEAVTKNYLQNTHKISYLYDNLSNLKVLANQNSISFNSKLDVNNNVIEEVGQGVNNTDACNKQQIESLITAGVNSATQRQRMIYGASSITNASQIYPSSNQNFGASLQTLHYSENITRAKISTTGTGWLLQSGSKYKVTVVIVAGPASSNSSPITTIIASNLSGTPSRTFAGTSISLHGGDSGFNPHITSNVWHISEPSRAFIDCSSQNQNFYVQINNCASIMGGRHTSSLGANSNFIPMSYIMIEELL